MLDREPFNKIICQQMIELYDNGEYIKALIVGKDSLPSKDGFKVTIDELEEEILNKPNEYFLEEMEKSLRVSDYKALEIILYYKGIIGLDYDSVEKYKKVYEEISNMQGVYILHKSAIDDIQFYIDGFDLIIGQDRYALKCVLSDYEIEGITTIYKTNYVFEKGELKYLGTGLVEIKYHDGTCKSYESDKREAWEEEMEAKKETQKEEQRLKEEKEKAEYLANEPKIGMTAEEVRNSNWGEPKDINKTTYAWGTTEQWCYPGYKYIYFTNGKVDAIRE
ncbi:MAG: hypothetical protein IKW30_03960 [Lachnospiraceae bacterium]|nr:hypothetical protein [Lachnospiraceae bacterium]